MDWFCLESGTNIPVFYRMYFTQDENYPQLHDDEKVSGERNPTLELFIQQSKRDIEDLKHFVWHLNQTIDEIHPKEIRKYSIGPYYDSCTENSEEMENIFNGIKNPSALKFTTEMVLSVDVRRKPLKNWKEHINAFFSGRFPEKEIYSEQKIMEYGLIVPFRIAQKLKNRDEIGNRCKIYGVTESGEISGV